MATVIRLQRGGRKKRPFYSIVVVDSRKRRDGAFIEKLGYYDPCRDPEVIEVDLERVASWKEKGAKLSPRVASIVKHASNPEAQAKAAAAAAERAAAKQAAADEAEKKAAEAAQAAAETKAEEASGEAGEAGGEEAAVAEEKTDA